MTHGYRFQVLGTTSRLNYPRSTAAIINSNTRRVRWRLPPREHCLFRRRKPRIPKRRMASTTQPPMAAPRTPTTRLAFRPFSTRHPRTQNRTARTLAPTVPGVRRERPLDLSLMESVLMAPQLRRKGRSERMLVLCTFWTRSSVFKRASQYHKPGRSAPSLRLLVYQRCKGWSVK